MKKTKNKGFTLIELLGVIIILIAMLSLILPKVINRVKSKEDIIASIDDDIIMSAVKLYVENNKKDYPEVDGSTYCIYSNDSNWNEISKYLSKTIDYDGQSINKNIQIDYDSDKGYILSKTNGCVESRPSSEAQTNSVCYVSKSYNVNDDSESVYLYEWKNINISNSNNLSGHISYYSSTDECKYESLKQAAQQYVKDHPTDFRKINGNSYCLSLNTLISKGYLKNDEIIFDNNLGQNIPGNTDIRSYSFSVEYDRANDRYLYTLSNSCTARLTCGTYIDLASNLTPVKYDSSKKKWVITTEDDPYWFDYNNQEWANAVVLTETAKNSKSVGDVVEVDTNDKKYGTNTDNTIDSLDVYAMYVWIPRFSYTIRRKIVTSAGTDYLYYGDDTIPNSPTLTDTNTRPIKVGAIDVKCVSKNAPKETGSGYYNYGNSVSGWYTMPAFTFGSTELNGIWMSKFLTSSTSNAYNDRNIVNCTDDNCSYSDNLRTLPNMQALTMAYVSTKFKHVFFSEISLNRSGGVYRVNNSTENIHLSRNSEWASLIYLSYSIYGRYGNSDYQLDDKYVSPNARSGSTAKTGKNCYNLQINSCVVSNSVPYDNTTYGGWGSTTGNITGVYDVVFNDGANLIVAAASQNVITSKVGNYANYFDIVDSLSSVHNMRGQNFIYDINCVGCETAVFSSDNRTIIVRSIDSMNKIPQSFEYRGNASDIWASSSLYRNTLVRY